MQRESVGYRCFVAKKRPARRTKYTGVEYPHLGSHEGQAIQAWL